MQEFFIFYAPFLVLIGVIIVAFITAPLDDPVTTREEESSSGRSD